MMRFLEGLLLFAMIGLFWTERRFPWIRSPFLAIGLILVLVLHGVWEGFRWQMVPAYLLVLVWALLALRPEIRLGNLAIAIGVIWGIIALFLPLAFPVPKLSPPDGPFAVGTMIMPLIDTSRQEIYAAQPGDSREMLIQVWYPAAQTSGAMERYQSDDHILARATTSYLHLPFFFLDHLSLVKTPAYAHAKAAPGVFPVVLFSHGWAGTHTQNTVQMIMLASHGYIAIAIDHPYGASAVAFPNGHVIYQNPQALPSNISDAEYQQAARRLVAQWSADASFLFDQLALLQQGEISSPLSGHLDLSRIGMFGHSTGGGNTVETCFRDERCNAALLLDPWLVPVSAQAFDSPLDKPMLVMRSPLSVSNVNRPLVEAYIARQSSPTFDMVVNGAQHYDFTDFPMLSPLGHAMGFKGPINGNRIETILNAATLAFFDRYLKEVDAPPLADLAAGFEEVTFEQK